MSSSIKLPAEEQALLTGAGVSLKVDLASCLTSPPHVLITHQAHNTDILEKLAEGSFVLTDSQDAMTGLRDNGFVNIAAVDTLGMTLFRKVCYSSLCLLYFIRLGTVKLSWLVSDTGMEGSILLSPPPTAAKHSDTTHCSRSEWR